MLHSWRPTWAKVSNGALATCPHRHHILSPWLRAILSFCLIFFLSCFYTHLPRPSSSFKFTPFPVPHLPRRQLSPPPFSCYARLPPHVTLTLNHPWAPSFEHSLNHFPSMRSSTEVEEGRPFFIHFFWRCTQHGDIDGDRQSRALSCCCRLDWARRPSSLCTASCDEYIGIILEFVRLVFAPLLLIPIGWPTFCCSSWR